MICSERVEDAYNVNAKLLYGAAIGDKETVNLEALDVYKRQEIARRLSATEEEVRQILN